MIAWCQHRREREWSYTGHAARSPARFGLADDSRKNGWSIGALAGGEEGLRGHVLVTEFWGMALYGLFWPDVLQPLDHVPLTDLTLQRYQEHSFSRLFVLKTIRSQDYLFPWWNFHSQDHSFPGTFIPRNESYVEHSFPGPFVPENAGLKHFW